MKSQAGMSRDISVMKKCSFKARVWKYKGAASWYFITIPKPLSKKIRKTHGISEEGWGRLKIVAKIGRRKWRTSIWFDSRVGGYLLPVKSEIRKKENIEINIPIRVMLEFPKEDVKRLSWLLSR